MSDQNVNLEDLEKELLKIVEQLAPQAIKAARPAMQNALDYLHQNVPPYPSSQPPGGGMKTATAKARGYFFAAVKEGKIPGWKWVPARKVDGKTIPAHPEGGYIRTGHLGQSITTEVTSVDNSVTGEIGSNAPYAPWVIGPGYPGEAINGKTMYQAKIHEGRWYRLPDVMDEHAADAQKIFEDDLFDGLAKAFAKGGSP